MNFVKKFSDYDENISEAKKDRKLKRVQKLARKISRINNRAAKLDQKGKVVKATRKDDKADQKQEKIDSLVSNFNQKQTKDQMQILRDELKTAQNELKDVKKSGDEYDIKRVESYIATIKEIYAAIKNDASEEEIEEMFNMFTQSMSNEQVEKMNILQDLLEDEDTEKISPKEKEEAEQKGEQEFQDKKDKKDKKKEDEKGRDYNEHIEKYKTFYDDVSKSGQIPIVSPKYSSNENYNKLIQDFLIQSGSNIEKTGKLDEATLTAIEEYQKKKGLKGDKEVGKLTWSKILTDVGVKVEGELSYDEFLRGMQSSQADKPSKSEITDNQEQINAIKDELAEREQKLKEIANSPNTQSILKDLITLLAGENMHARFRSTDEVKVFRSLIQGLKSHSINKFNVAAFFNGYEQKVGSDSKGLIKDLMFAFDSDSGEINNIIGVNKDKFVAFVKEFGLIGESATGAGIVASMIAGKAAWGNESYMAAQLIFCFGSFNDQIVNAELSAANINITQIQNIKKEGTKEIVDDSINKKKNSDVDKQIETDDTDKQTTTKEM
jgi:hypothetical protein